MSKSKWFVIIAYLIVAALLWLRFSTPQVFDSVSLQSIVHGFILAVVGIFWVGMVYVLQSCYFSKRAIQRQLTRAERPLGHIATAKLKSYKPSKTGNYVTFQFYAAGIPEDEWERKRTAVQSAINYTIIGNITNDGHNLGTIVFKARKGCLQTNKGILHDDL